jgi:hypothetical protein
MLRAVLVLLWWQGATCSEPDVGTYAPTMVTERRPRWVLPSKKSKKVDCGGWNHPDSEKNTRTTVYGRIGLVCRGVGARKPAHVGTGFDDDGPRYDDYLPNYDDYDENGYEYADPYVCWNKHLYKAYVGWNLAAAYAFSAGFLLVKAKITGAAKKPAHNDGWNTVNLLVQEACLVAGIVSYYILTSKTMGVSPRDDKCNFFLLVTMPLSKTVAFPGVQAVDALFREWKVSEGKDAVLVYHHAEHSDHWASCLLDCLLPGKSKKIKYKMYQSLEGKARLLNPICIACCAVCIVPLAIYSIGLYVVFFPLVMYLALCMMLAVMIPFWVLTGALSYNKECEAILEEKNDEEDDSWASWASSSPGVLGIYVTKILFPVMYMLLLFGIYVEPFYNGTYAGDDDEARGFEIWLPLAREVFFSVNPFDWENLRVAFAWPDRLPYVDQIFFAISISMACLDFVVQNLLARKEDSDEDSTAAKELRIVSRKSPWTCFRRAARSDDGATTDADLAHAAHDDTRRGGAQHRGGDAEPRDVETPQLFRVGERVNVVVHGVRWYSGTIHDVMVGKCSVACDDRKTRTVKIMSLQHRDAPSTVELAVGAKVEANWLGHSTWYAATVSAKRADGTYNLTYDDGACEDKVHADRIRNRAAATTVSGVEAAGVELFT